MSMVDQVEIEKSEMPIEVNEIAIATEVNEIIVATGEQKSETIGDIDIEQAKKAAEFYYKKRLQGREYYKLNSEKCRKYNQERRMKLKLSKSDDDTTNEISGETLEEKKLRLRTHARERYHANRDEHALRQKLARQKRRALYNQYRELELSKNECIGKETPGADACPVLDADKITD